MYGWGKFLYAIPSISRRTASAEVSHFAMEAMHLGALDDNVHLHILHGQIVLAVRTHDLDQLFDFQIGTQSNTRWRSRWVLNDAIRDLVLGGAVTGALRQSPPSEHHLNGVLEPRGIAILIAILHNHRWSIGTVDRRDGGCITAGWSIRGGWGGGG